MASRPSPEALLSHADFVRSLARGLLSDVQAAEDVAQETLVAALERPPRSTDGLRAWLRQVTRNFALQRLRGAGRRRAREERAAGLAHVPTPAEIVEREAARAAVVHAVLQLPEAARQVVVLRYYRDLPTREIARLLDLPHETARTRLKRALAALRAELETSEAREGVDGSRDARGLVLLSHLASPGGAGGPGAVLLAGLGAKLATAAAVLVLGLVAWRVLAPPPRGLEPTTIAGSHEDPDRPAPAAAVAPAAERVPLAAAAPATVRGSVRSHAGAPVAGARVYASAAGPIDAGRPGHDEGTGGSSAAPPVWAATDAEGAFELALPEPGSVHVAVLGSADPFFLPGEGRWVDAPAEGVDLVLVDAPRAGLIVRARRDTGEVLSGFRLDAHSKATLSYRSQVAEGPELRCELPLARGARVEEFELHVRHGQGPPFVRQVELEAGTWTEVEALLTGTFLVEGRVEDETGQPVADALVFFGIQARMRGDEPFQPYDPKRVPDAVRTAADGSFLVDGSGDRLSVWSEGLSPVTVPLAEAGRIVLPPRGALRGRVIDANGRPREQALVSLDRAAPLPTDAGGRFAFDDVPAGMRGLSLELPAGSDGLAPRKRWIVVELAPGADLEVEIGPGHDFELELEDGEDVLARAARVTLLGLDPLATVHELRLEQGRGRVAGALPGRYLLVARDGPLAFLTLDAPAVRCAAGSADLTVEAPSGEQVFLVPAGANELVELLAARTSAVHVPAAGLVRFEALPPGRWAVGLDGKGLQAEVDVPGPGAHVRLP